MHALFRIPWNCSKTCVAAIGVMHFSCVASAAHFLLGDLHMNIKVELLKKLEADMTIKYVI